MAVTIRIALTLLLFCLFSGNLQSATTSSQNIPTIAIIIDDLGYHYQRTKTAVNLPGPVTLSFLPHTPHAVELAQLAHQKNKEVLLHLPMESIDHADLDAGGIHLDMDQMEIKQTLRRDLAIIPHVVGINNHMGSLVSQHPGHVSALMQVVRDYDLFFVDSFTTSRSIIQKIANENWVPNIKRDVFLDNDRDAKAINQQFNQLLRIARIKGIALAIAHPYPQTLAVLKRRLNALESQGFRLVPASQLIKMNMQRFKTWRAFLSP